MGLSLRNNQIFRPKRQDTLDRRIWRRHKFIQETILRIEPEAFAAEESIDLFTGRPIDAGRAARRAARRASLHCSDCQFLPRPIQVDGDLSRAHRPVRKLSRLNRSVVFPSLVPTEPKIEPVALNEILAKLRSGHHDSQPHHLLDALATASGISWESCAQIVFNQKLFSAPIGLDDVKAARDRSLLLESVRARPAQLFGVNPGKTGSGVASWACDTKVMLAMVAKVISVLTLIIRFSPV